MGLEVTAFGIGNEFAGAFVVLRQAIRLAIQLINVKVAEICGSPA